MWLAGLLAPGMHCAFARVMPHRTAMFVEMVHNISPHHKEEQEKNQAEIEEANAGRVTQKLRATDCELSAIAFTASGFRWPSKLAPQTEAL